MSSWSQVSVVTIIVRDVQRIHANNRRMLLSFCFTNGVTNNSILKYEPYLNDLIVLIQSWGNERTSLKSLNGTEILASFLGPYSKILLWRHLLRNIARAWTPLHSQKHIYECGIRHGPERLPVLRVGNCHSAWLDRLLKRCLPREDCNHWSLRVWGPLFC